MQRKSSGRGRVYPEREGKGFARRRREPVDRVWGPFGCYIDDERAVLVRPKVEARDRIAALGVRMKEFAAVVEGDAPPFGGKTGIALDPVTVISGKLLARLSDIPLIIDRLFP